MAGKQVSVGRPAWISTLSKPEDTLVQKLEAFAQAGYTPVAIAVDGVMTAALALGDRPRKEARTLIETLEQQGMAIYLLSGDHASVVHHMARQLGIPAERTFGDMSPEDKKRFVDQLPGTVAMVGDGVNDAAALQAAAVGIAVEGGSTPSQVAADVFLTREGLQPILEVFNGSNKVMNVIRRNLRFSLFYNAAGATAAIVGLVTPLVAAIAMPLSSLVVVAGSIFQKSFDR